MSDQQLYFADRRSLLCRLAGHGDEPAGGFLAGPRNLRSVSTRMEYSDRRVESLDKAGPHRTLA